MVELTGVVCFSENIILNGIDFLLESFYSLSLTSLRLRKAKVNHSMLNKLMIIVADFPQKSQAGQSKLSGYYFSSDR